MDTIQFSATTVQDSRSDVHDPLEFRGHTGPVPRLRVRGLVPVVRTDVLDVSGPQVVLTAGDLVSRPYWRVYPLGTGTSGWCRDDQGGVSKSRCFDTRSMFNSLLLNELGRVKLGRYEQLYFTTDGICYLERLRRYGGR